MPLDPKRLHKFVCLFDAPSEGERMVALGMANRLLAEHGVTWRDFVVTPRPSPAARPIQAERQTPALCDCEDCCRYAADQAATHPEFENLGEKHKSFIRSVGKKWKNVPLSEKQRAYVFSLADQLGVARRKAA